MPRSYEQLVVVSNPTSSRARDIRRDVLHPLDRERIAHVAVETQSGEADALAEQLTACVRPGDRVLEAGGDGMAALAVNALQIAGLLSEVQVGFMAYGNRSDSASISGKAKRNVLAMANDDMGQKEFHPLHVRTIDSAGTAVHDWLALSYLTLGELTTGAAEHFSDGEVRKRIVGKRAMFLRSAVEMVKYYNNHRPNRNFLGERFEITYGTSLGQTEATDIVLLNGSRMASVVWSPEAYCFHEEKYHYAELNTARLALIAQTAVKMVSQGGIPGADVYRTCIEHKHPHQPMNVQTDGEFYSLRGVRRLFVDKPLRFAFRVLADKQ